MNKYERRAGRTVGRPSLEVVETIGAGLHVFTANVGSPQMPAYLLIVDPQGIKVKDYPGDNCQQQKPAEGLEESPHGPSLRDVGLHCLTLG